MKKHFILLAVLMLALSGCSYGKKSLNNNNQLPQISSENSIQTLVTSSTTPSKEQSTEEGLKQALKVKFSEIKDVSVSSIRTDKDANNQDIRAVGENILDPQREDIAGNMGGFLAVKNSDGSWKIVYSGNGRPTCAELQSELIQYNFSDTLLEGICAR